MPLIKSKSDKAVGKNIAIEEAAGKPRRQAVAIALDTQRRAGRNAAMHEGGLCHGPMHDKMGGLCHESGTANCGTKGMIKKS